MAEAGIVAVSDDGRPVMSAGLMRRALEYAHTFDLPVIQHAEDLALAEGGVMNEGPVATRLGLRGQPPQAESVMVARDLELVEWTGGRYHVAHVSTARSVNLVREAKRRGLPVSCEVAPHHFALSDEACTSYDTSTKVAPPLRSGADVDALREALADGTVDCIATDHAPHSAVEKDVEFDLAACGMLGLETALPLALELVRDGILDLPSMVGLLTARPAALFGLDRNGTGSLKVWRASGRLCDRSRHGMDCRSRQYAVEVQEHALSRARGPGRRYPDTRWGASGVRSTGATGVMDSSAKPAVLVLESGRVFSGELFGAQQDRFGEVVFNTSMTGYQEILTDPSYAGQIVVMTSTQIGNTGVNGDDLEAERPACAGFVVREASPVAESWRSRGQLGAYLSDAGVAGIQGVDTRALTRAIRDGGAQRGVISTRVDEIDGLLQKVRQWPSMKGRDLVPEVTCEKRYDWDEGTWRAPDLAEVPASQGRLLSVVAYDFGIKRGILRGLVDAGCRVTVVPASTPASEVLALKADGYFLSNGPGDPAAVGYAVETVKGLLASDVPVFGICLGFQIMTLALGAKTFKLPFGHHGGNHPVMDLSTRKVEITSQNHGFAVERESLPSGVECTHINLYDQTVEGIEVTGRRVFGVQYHPEASPGPHDASYLFARFVDSMQRAD